MINIYGLWLHLFSDETIKIVYSRIDGVLPLRRKSFGRANLHDERKAGKGARINWNGKWRNIGEDDTGTTWQGTEYIRF